MPRSKASIVSASSQPSEPPRRESDVFVVGSGDCAALIDHVEILETEPTQASSGSDASQRYPDVVRQFRDRVVNQRTGKPLAVRLDRRLFSPANAERRRRLEDRIRAMHGSKLQDGRTLQVDEVLGRYGEWLGGIDQQLSEVHERLDQGEHVRLAVQSGILSDSLYRQLGVLSDRFGGQLNVAMDREPSASGAFHNRLATEASRAHFGEIRQRLQEGEQLELRVESAALTPSLREEIRALQREFGPQFRIETEDPPGRARPTSAAIGPENRPPRPLESQSPDFLDISTSAAMPASPSEHEDRTMWAREVAARVRKPWWRRLAWLRKASRGSSTPE